MTYRSADNLVTYEELGQFFGGSINTQVSVLNDKFILSNYSHIIWISEDYGDN